MQPGFVGTLCLDHRAKQNGPLTGPPYGVARLSSPPVLILVLMEYGLRDQGQREPLTIMVLILVLMEYGLRGSLLRIQQTILVVLILVLMEYGLRELHMLHQRVSFGS